MTTEEQVRHLHRQVETLSERLRSVEARCEPDPTIAPTRKLHRPRSQWPAAVLGLGVALLLPVLVYAGPLSIPNLFSNGTIADANHVNENFEYLATATDILEARIAQLEADLAIVDFQVTVNATEVSGLQETQIPCASQVGNEVYFTNCNVNLGGTE